MPSRHVERAVPRHVGRTPRLPADLVAGRRDRRVEGERLATIVEAAGDGAIRVDRDQPDLGLVDHGDRERTVGRDGRGGTRSLERGEPPWSPGPRLQPEFTVDGHVHDAGAVREPVEAATVHAATRAWIGRRRQHPLRATVDVDDRHRAASAPALHERDGAAVRREPGFGELTTGQDQIDRDGLDRGGLGRHGTTLRRGRAAETRLIAVDRAVHTALLTAKEVPDD